MISEAFHHEHHRMYGYSLQEEGTPIDLINVRVRAIGMTEKPSFAEEPFVGHDADATLKGERDIYVPDEQAWRAVPVYDGHQTRHGHRIAGPAVIEQVNTTLLLTASFDCVCDQYGSFVAYRKGEEQQLGEFARNIETARR